MDSTQTIMTYKAILATTGKMLIAAQNHKWDELVLLEQECRRLAEFFLKKIPEPILDKELQQKKIRIIHQILDDDAQIRTITESWMARLQFMASTNEYSRKHHQAYQVIDNL